jgi:hypothetical protein
VHHTVKGLQAGPFSGPADAPCFAKPPIFGFGERFFGAPVSLFALVAGARGGRGRACRGSPPSAVARRTEPRRWCRPLSQANALFARRFVRQRSSLLSERGSLAARLPRGWDAAGFEVSLEEVGFACWVFFKQGPCLINQPLHFCQPFSWRERQAAVHQGSVSRAKIRLSGYVCVGGHIRSVGEKCEDRLCRVLPGKTIAIVMDLDDFAPFDGRAGQSFLRESRRALSCCFRGCQVARSAACSASCSARSIWRTSGSSRAMPSRSAAGGGGTER